MIDIHAWHYKLDDDLYHLWNWLLPDRDVKYTDCGIKMGKVSDSRLSGVSDVDKLTLCPKCFSYYLSHFKKEKL